MTSVDRQLPAAHLDPNSDITAAAHLFRALSSPLRVQILLNLAESSTVSQLVASVGASQPLISQHLRVLRAAGLVTVTRSGREAYYVTTDAHVSHVVRDAVTHAGEPTARGDVAETDSTDDVSDVDQPDDSPHS